MINPLAFVFNTFPTSPESPALAAYFFADALRADALDKADSISP